MGGQNGEGGGTSDLAFWGAGPGGGDYGAGAGMRARATLGTSVQPSMCWQVRIQMALRAHVLARELAVTAVDIDDGALPVRLWNGADLHVVSGTRLPRRWPTCPQLGGCLNLSKTRSSDARSINFSWVERQASALGIAGLSGTGGAEINNKGAKTPS
jgi:hypothetical protein